MVLHVTSPESRGPSPLVPRCRFRLKGFVVKWFRQHGLGFHAGEWLALAMIVFLSFALGIAVLKLVFSLLTRERDTDESEDDNEKDYWHTHGG